MDLSREAQLEFEELSKPLIKWLNDRYLPECFIIIDHMHSDLVESVVSMFTRNYLPKG